MCIIRRDVECRTVDTHMYANETNDAATCDPDIGLQCRNGPLRPPCRDYEIRFLCCGTTCPPKCWPKPTTPEITTTQPPPSTTPPPETTTPETTTTKPPPDCRKCLNFCVWTPWCNDEAPGRLASDALVEEELLSDVQHYPGFPAMCIIRRDVECRTVDTHMYANETNDAATCDPDIGLQCRNGPLRPPCRDYEIRFLCCGTTCPPKCWPKPTTPEITTTQPPPSTTPPPETTTPETTTTKPPPDCRKCLNFCVWTPWCNDEAPGRLASDALVEEELLSDVQHYPGFPAMCIIRRDVECRTVDTHMYANETNDAATCDPDIGLQCRNGPLRPPCRDYEIRFLCCGTTCPPKCWPKPTTPEITTTQPPPSTTPPPETTTPETTTTKPPPDCRKCLNFCVWTPWCNDEAPGRLASDALVEEELLSDVQHYPGFPAMCIIRRDVECRTVDTHMYANETNDAATCDPDIGLQCRNGPLRPPCRDYEIRFLCCGTTCPPKCWPKPTTPEITTTQPPPSTTPPPETTTPETTTTKPPPDCRKCLNFCVWTPWCNDEAPGRLASDALVEEELLSDVQHYPGFPAMCIIRRDVECRTVDTHMYANETNDAATCDPDIGLQCRNGPLRPPCRDYEIRFLCCGTTCPPKCWPKPTTPEITTTQPPPSTTPPPETTTPETTTTKPPPDCRKCLNFCVWTPWCNDEAPGRLASDALVEEELLSDVQHYPGFPAMCIIRRDVECRTVDTHMYANETNDAATCDPDIGLQCRNGPLRPPCRDYEIRFLCCGTTCPPKCWPKPTTPEITTTQPPPSTTPPPETTTPETTTTKPPPDCRKCLNFCVWTPWCNDEAPGRLASDALVEEELLSDVQHYPGFPAMCIIRRDVECRTVDTHMYANETNDAATCDPDIGLQCRNGPLRPPCRDYEIRFLCCGTTCPPKCWPKPTTPEITTTQPPPSTTPPPETTTPETTTTKPPPDCRKCLNFCVWTPWCNDEAPGRLASDALVEEELLSDVQHYPGFPAMCIIRRDVECRTVDTHMYANETNDAATCDPDIGLQCRNGPLRPPCRDYEIRFLCCGTTCPPKCWPKPTTPEITTTQPPPSTTPPPETTTPETTTTKPPPDCRKCLNFCVWTPWCNDEAPGRLASDALVEEELLSDVQHYPGFPAMCIIRRDVECRTVDTHMYANETNDAATCDPDIGLQCRNGPLRPPCRDYEIRFLCCGTTCPPKCWPKPTTPEITTTQPPPSTTPPPETTTPETTTTKPPPDCRKCLNFCVWTPWCNDEAPGRLASDALVEEELLSDVQHYPGFPAMCIIRRDVECRTVDTHMYANETNDAATCDPDIGLQCRNGPLRPPCRDYEIRFLCCGTTCPPKCWPKPTTPEITTTQPPPSTTPPPETTTPETTTTKPPPDCRKCLNFCVWTPWCNDEAPGRLASDALVEEELLSDVQHYPGFPAMCIIRRDVECRTVDTHMYANETNDAATCDPDIGLQCRNGPLRPPCRDYEIRFLCCGTTCPPKCWPKPTPPEITTPHSPPPTTTIETTTPETTTPERPECEKCLRFCVWTPWCNDEAPGRLASDALVEEELLSDVQHYPGFPAICIIRKDVECRTVDTHIFSNETDDAATCDPEIGLQCRNGPLRPPCRDYEIRFLCCGSTCPPKCWPKPTTPRTPPPTTTLPPPTTTIETTTPETTTPERPGNAWHPVSFMIYSKKKHKIKYNSLIILFENNMD
ncbi:uncharacterized protein [Diadema antillarum]|uniref:uncharacterized protein n=1 Tax=Diadema antillarum TaxID=105358 RepID=UPI003A855249